MQTQNVMKSLGEYTTKDAKTLKQKTDSFIKNLMNQKGLKSLQYADTYANAIIAEIPIELIVVPEYQITRHNSNKEYVDEILSDYENRMMEFVKINYRTAGTGKGFLYIADGQHRTEVQAKLGAKNVLAFVFGYDFDNEIIEFSRRDEDDKNIARWHKYERRLMLDPKSKPGQAPLACADRIIRNTFLMLRVDPRRAGLAVASLEKILVSKNNKLVDDAVERCEWLMDVLINSRFYITNGKNGLSADAIAAINNIYIQIGKGLFSDAGYKTVSHFAKKALLEQTHSDMFVKINDYLFDEINDYPLEGNNAPIWTGMHHREKSMTAYLVWQIYESLGMDFLEVKDQFVD